MLIGGVGWMAGPACSHSAAERDWLYRISLCRDGRWEGSAMELQRRLWQINEINYRPL